MQMVLNAAIGIMQSRLSQDGIDDHFQVNMLSQLHLALTLLPRLEATSELTGVPARLVFMSSATHCYAPGNTQFNSLEELNKDLGKQAHYYRSKLAQILIVRQLARAYNRDWAVDADGNSGTNFEAARLEALDKKGPLTQTVSVKRQVLINATHPGDYNRTPLTDNLKNAFGIFGWILLLVLAPFMSDPMTQGCQPALFACTPNAELLRENPHGSYIVPFKRVVQPSQPGRDDNGLGENVWRLSNRLLKEKLQKTA